MFWLRNKQKIFSVTHPYLGAWGTQKNRLNETILCSKLLHLSGPMGKLNSVIIEAYTYYFQLGGRVLLLQPRQGLRPILTISSWDVGFCYCNQGKV